MKLLKEKMTFRKTLLVLFRLTGICAFIVALVSVVGLELTQRSHQELSRFEQRVQNCRQGFREAINDLKDVNENTSSSDYFKSNEDCFAELIHVSKEMQGLLPDFWRLSLRYSRALSEIGIMVSTKRNLSSEDLNRYFSRGDSSYKDILLGVSSSQRESESREAFINENLMPWSLSFLFAYLAVSLFIMGARVYKRIKLERKARSYIVETPKDVEKVKDIFRESFQLWKMGGAAELFEKYSEQLSEKAAVEMKFDKVASVFEGLGNKSEQKEEGESPQFRELDNGVEVEHIPRDQMKKKSVGLDFELNHVNFESRPGDVDNFEEDVPSNFSQAPLKESGWSLQQIDDFYRVLDEAAKK